MQCLKMEDQHKKKKILIKDIILLQLVCNAPYNVTVETVTYKYSTNRKRLVTFEIETQFFSCFVTSHVYMCHQRLSVC